VKQTELIQLLSSPHNAIYGDLEKLQDLKKQFPFFQSAHMLLTLVSKKFDSGIYQNTLRKTAISIPNRARLYKLLNNAEIDNSTDLKSVPVKNKTSEIEHLKAIELHSQKIKVSEKELNEQVEKEIEKQVVSAIVEKEVLKTHDRYTSEEKKPENKEFKKEERKQISSGSFTDWLNTLKKAGDVEEIETEKKEIKERESRIITEFKKPIDKKAEEKAIIDKIIESEPGNIRLDPNQRFYEANIKAKEGLLENEHLVTETLAKIYALQGNISKAIRAYEILSLRFPQKSVYFASLIEDLKKENK
jgi:hypothetical protein